MKKKRNIVLVILVLFLLILGMVILFYSGGNDGIKNLLPVDENAETWTGRQNLPQKGGESRGISIPGFQSIVFYADSEEQSVNFFNPESNRALFKLTLFADGQQIWQSDGYLKPGSAFYNITLTKTLSEGEYDGELLYECASEEEGKLNSARIKFKIQAITKEQQ